MILYLTKNQENYNYFRNYKYNFINDNKYVYSIDYPYIMNNDDIIYFESYINKISKDAFFADEWEILLSSKIFNINIIVLKYNDKYKVYIQQLNLYQII